MDRSDVVAVIGFALLIAGLWICKPWIALVVAGALLLKLANKMNTKAQG